MSKARALVGLVFLLAASDTLAEPVGIVSPGSAAPAVVAPGKTLFVLVRMKLPLTPPPGVQQPAAKKDWRAELKKRMIRSDGALQLIAFNAHVVRYRPERDDVYRVTVEVSPWTPPGIYDLFLFAPGTEEVASAAVHVGGEQGTARLNAVGQNHFHLINESKQPVRYNFSLVLPEKVPGVRVELDGKVVKPDFAGSVGTQSGSRDRVLEFGVSIDAATEMGPGQRSITWHAVKPAPCQGTIEFNLDPQKIDPTMRTGLSFKTDGEKPAFVAWDFGDGTRAVGETTSHLFMLTESVKVRAWGFDHHGRLCPAEAMARVTKPLDRSDCACRQAGHIAGNNLLMELLGYCLPR